MTYVPQFQCACGERSPRAQAEAVWLQTGMGVTCCWSHPGCVEETIRSMAALWHGAKRIAEPKTKAERESEAREAETAKRAEYEDLADHRLF